MLGSLEVKVGGGWTGAAAPKWRAVLGALIAAHGQVIPTQVLAEEGWEDDPPPAAPRS